MVELNKEVSVNEEDITLLLEELSTREEMICKGHACGLDATAI